MSECGRDCGCGSDVSRRDFLKVGAGTAGLIYGTQAARAVPGEIPPECRTPPPQEWFDQLAQPGETITYSGAHLRNLIFPLGGIGTGTIWLHGSGRLVNWQIFNNIQKNTLVDDTFFAVRVEQEGKPPIVRVLQQQGVGPFPGIMNVRFTGRYPVATLTFSDPELPVDVELEAFNPLVPLDEKESGLPCAVFTVRATNKTDKPVSVSFLSTLQNAIGHAGKGTSTGVVHGGYGGSVNQVLTDGRMTAVAMKAEPGKAARIKPPVDLLIDHDLMPRIDASSVEGLTLIGVGQPKTNASIQTAYWLANGSLKQLGGSVLEEIARGVGELGAVLLLSGVANPLLERVRSTEPAKVRRRETVYASFDDKSFGQWTAEGGAFRSPKTGAVGEQSPVSGFLGAGLVNTFDPDDRPKGKLTSPEFLIKENYISMLVGGGNHPGACCVNLTIDNKVVRTATGKNSEWLQRVDWDVSELVNREARIEVVDSKSNPWGHILLDDVRFSNLPTNVVTVEEADAWNGLIDEMKQADLMTMVPVGKGRVMRVPVEFGTAKPGVDPIIQRDRVLSVIASLAGVTYRPQAGRPSDSPSFGTMCLATQEPDVRVRAGWTDRNELFRRFAETGTAAEAVESGPGKPTLVAGPTDAGRTLNAALSTSRTVRAGGESEATFVYTWHFPNQYYPQNNYKVAGNKAVLVGNMYANWYADATMVAREVMSNLGGLRKRTAAYRRAMFDTTLPQYFIDAVAANVSIIRSPTCFRAKDGTFFGFEGCRPEGNGCCPMNCNHVWNYEQTLAKLWPALERDMRKTELRYHQREDGMINHRVSVPRDNPHKTPRLVADGQCGAVLKAYREHLQSRDGRFLADYWERIAKAMDFAIKQWDPDGDGVMETPQFNTYDRDIFGHNTFVSSLYLAALRAAEEMAKLSRDEGAARRYRELFEKGRAKMAEILFDGEYYIQKADDLKGGYGKGCWSDQVVGQWWARILDLGDILPNDQVQSALKAIYKHSWLWKTAGFEGTQRFLQFGDGDDKGLLCGSWPKGGRPGDPIFYRDEYWTGIEYQVAGHKIYEGQIGEALAIVKGARERYDGLKKSPWNEIECGDYYARALSSWSLLLAAQGYAYDGPSRRLTLNLRLGAADHRSFFTTAEGWGQFSQKRNGKTQTAQLAIIGGRCELGELRLGLPAEAKTVEGSVRLNDRNIPADLSIENGVAVIELHGSVAAKADDTLYVTLAWS